MSTQAEFEARAADALIDHQRREIGALQLALLGMIMDDNACHIACKEYQNHPTPWHAEKCGCACEARNAYRAQIEGSLTSPRTPPPSEPSAS